MIAIRVREGKARTVQAYVPARASLLVSEARLIRRA